MQRYNNLGFGAKQLQQWDDINPEMHIVLQVNDLWLDMVQQPL